MVTKECRICGDEFEIGVIGFSVNASMCTGCQEFTTRPKDAVCSDYQVERPCNRCSAPLPVGRRFNCRHCLPDGCENYPTGLLNLDPIITVNPSEYGQLQEVFGPLELLSEL